MYTKLIPETGSIYLMQHYSVLYIKKGNGLAQIDFTAYDNLENKMIYLSPGQYIKFLFGRFEVWIKEIAQEIPSRIPESRVLFKHLISFGYIDDNGLAQLFFADTNLQCDNDKELLSLSVESWFHLNPFQAAKEEYQLIFNFRDRLDEQLAEKKFSAKKISQAINSKRENTLLHKRLGLSVKKMVQKRLKLEAQRQLGFTGKSVKEVAGQLGYKDPAYFNRVFAEQNNSSPLEFRKAFNYSVPDSFVQNLEEVIRKYHTTEHSSSFYAGKMHLSMKTLHRKTNEKFSCSIGRLIRGELFSTAKKMLQEGMPVKEVAWHLGFEEPNHFSAFFKTVSGITPTAFGLQKVQ